MKITKLRNISKLYFGYEELAKVLGISLPSARVTANRYVKQGIFIRIKRNIYMLHDVWENTAREDRFLIANIAQTPSYISLMTALDYYDVTTQMQRDYFESIVCNRTKQRQINSSVLKYTRIAADLYFGFRKETDFFIASPEKALLDAFYLSSYGRYAFDSSSIDTNKLDMQQIKVLSKKFPLKTRNLLKKNGYL